MEILESNRSSEFEIQATLWMELKRLGYNVRGEVAAKYSHTTDRRQKCRFDLVVFDQGKCQGIIEVKPSKTKHKKEGGWLATRQGTRYAEYGLPVKIIYGMDQAKTFIEHAEKTNQLWQ